MSAKNQVQSIKARWVNNELLTTPEAIELLGYAGSDKGKGQGAFLAAVKSHDYLKAGKIEKSASVPFVLWEREAVDRYAAERKSGGGKRDGAVWYSARLTSAEAAQLTAYASVQFGREVTFEQPAVRASRLAAAKANFTNGQVEPIELENIGDDESEYAEV